jgi:hypothetical protein
VRRSLAPPPRRSDEVIMRARARLASSKLDDRRFARPRMNIERSIGEG